MRVTDFLDRAAESFPDRFVVHDGRQGTTYRDFQRLTKRIAQAILAAGLGAGTRIAIFSPNHVMGMAAMFGIARSGAVYVPLNVRNSPSENAAVVDALDVDWIFFHSSLSADARKLHAECRKVRAFVCLDRESDLGPALGMWLEGNEGEPPDRASPPDEEYALFTTSGTTGQPKGVVLTHLNFECSVASFHAVLDFDAPPAHLVVAPLTHAAGVYLVSVIAAGGTSYILPAPTPASILEWMERYRISTMFLPPTLIYMLLAEPTARGRDYSALKHICYGGAPMSTNKLREASDIFGHVFLQVFAQTEAIIPVTLLLPEDHAEALQDPEKTHRLLSCGRPTPFTRMAVLDEHGKVLPAGERGEVVVRGNLVMKGYYKNPEATAEVSAHGWHHTGDIGYVDEAGFVYLVDRKKDMIITGGLNVYPAEVEQVIWTHPSVLDCAVIGVPDEKWGEAVTAVVELKPGATLDGAELIALCKSRVGSVKAPKAVHIWPTLPRSPIGKVLKREIRDRFWTGRSRAI